MGRRWSKEEVAVLRGLVQKGCSVEQIVKTGKLPNRTARAIENKIKRDLSGLGSNNVEPICNPPSTPKETGHLTDLIALEWGVIDQLSNLAENAAHEKHKAQFYLGLASHVRILARLIKLAGSETGDTEDLAKLLQEITKKARRLSRGLKHESRRKSIEKAT